MKKNHTEFLAHALRGLLAHVESADVHATKAGGVGVIRYGRTEYSQVTEAREALRAYDERTQRSPVASVRALLDACNANGEPHEGDTEFRRGFAAAHRKIGAYVAGSILPDIARPYMPELLRDCASFLEGFEDEHEDGNAEFVAPLLARIRAIVGPYRVHECTREHFDDGDALEAQGCTDCVGVFVHDDALDIPTVYTVWEH